MQGTQNIKLSSVLKFPGVRPIVLIQAVSKLRRVWSSGGMILAVGKPKYWEENLSQHHLSTIGLTWAGIEPRPPRWSMRSIYIMYKNSVPTSQRTHCVLLGGHGLMLFREVILFTVELIQNKCTVWQSTFSCYRRWYINLPLCFKRC